MADYWLSSALRRQFGWNELSEDTLCLLPMEKDSAQIEKAQPALSQAPLVPEQDLGDGFCISACEVIEVRPPANTRKGHGARHEAVEQEFFPLVSAAHEFKTPLVVMLGYADLLRTGQLGPINAKQREVLGDIQESAERLQSLIQDLLLLCELRAHQGADTSQPEATADVNEQAREIFDFWAPIAKQRSVEYDFHPSPRKVQVRMEPLKLQHIISNLIENALKYTPARGRVAVRITPCFWERRKAQISFLFNLQRTGSQTVENAVRIDVTDTGPGVPPEHHEDIFLDFVQLAGASPRGTGLGLAIARRLTEAQGGAIWVESQLGQGSKFSVLLVQSSDRETREQ